MSSNVVNSKGMTDKDWNQRFAELVAQPEQSINLGEGALLIATDEYPHLDIPHYLQKLDAFAERAKSRVQAGGSAQERLEWLNDVLFGELRFRGNEESHLDAHNSYLNDVIDRRLGIPISLSIVYLEVGQRLGMPLYGVGLPGHFVVKWKDEREEVFVDPFHQGQIIDDYGMLQLIQDSLRIRVPFRSEWLDAVGPRYILLRMLNNLRGIFLQSENRARALGVLDKLLILSPYSEEYLREAGLLAYKLGHYRRAAEHLEEYLLHHGEAREVPHIRTVFRSVLVAIGRLN